jgi:hypothetical protein
MFARRFAPERLAFAASWFETRRKATLLTMRVEISPPKDLILRRPPKAAVSKDGREKIVRPLSLSYAVDLPSRGGMKKRSLDVNAAVPWRHAGPAH